MARCASIVIAAGVMVGCTATTPNAPAPKDTPPQVSNAAAPAAPATVESKPSPAATATPAARVESAGALGPSEVATRNALFKSARFADLPGWGRDDLSTAWDAFQTSCKALAQRESWKPLCRNAQKVPRANSNEIRRFFETEFTLFRILNADASAEGDVTGYYEPLIAGSLQREGSYTLPVYGVPNDLYTIDWKNIPPAQRRSTVYVSAQGRELRVEPARRAGSYALDASRFELDARDRRWRVRLVGDRALPYPARSEIDGARLDAPVVAWVDDALALYAMQVQGSGRIRLADGRVLRLQYAEQNGHPFRPLRVAAREKVVTRGAGGVEEPDRFELADLAPDAPADGEIVTRGAKRPTAPSTPTNSSGSSALVDELLAGAQRRPPAAGAKPVTRPSTTTSSASATGTAGSVAPLKAPTVLNTDPSYVFFRVAPDQSPNAGPIGALGVPLTAGRSIAVDPRVTPMGYPIYMSAPTPPGSTLALQRLVMAQDTGGAIRGATRADFFWGFGSQAGQQAMRTRQRGQMWLMLPHAEASKLASSALVTRGGTRGAASSECLIADEQFCTEPE